MLGEDPVLQLGVGRFDGAQPLVEGHVRRETLGRLVERVVAHLLLAVDDHVHLVGHVAGTEVVGGLVERLVLHLQVLHRELGVDEGPVDQPGQRAAARFGLGQVVLAVVRFWRTDEREEPSVGGERFDVGLEDLHLADRRNRRALLASSSSSSEHPPATSAATSTTRNQSGSRLRREAGGSPQVIA